MKIIILHGWGHNKDTWVRLASSLGSSATSFDLPGFGSELRPEATWGVKEYADWVHHKLQKEKRVVLIGHSFGGRVASQLASRRPKYLKGLVLSGSPCIYRPNAKTKMKIFIYKLLKNITPVSVRRIFYPKDLKNSHGMEDIFRKVVTDDQTATLPKIMIPTLIIWGEKDLEVPLSVAFEINSLIKGSQLKIIYRAGHNSYSDSPNLFYGIVNNFIKSL